MIGRRNFMQQSAVALGMLAIAPRLAVAEQQSTDGLIHLDSNENAFGPSGRAIEAVKKAAVRGNRYPDDELVTRLKSEIAGREGVTAEHIVFGAGSSEILAAAALAFGRDGQTVAADPTFALLQRWVERVGGSVTRVPLTASKHHDLEAMSRATDDATRIVYVCNPNNPTGTLLESAKLSPFVESQACTATVLVDEAYIEYLPDGSKHSMIDHVRAGRNVVVIRTFSKIYALAGLRIGYAIAPPPLAQKLSQFLTGIVSVTAIEAALASLDDEAFVARSRKRTAAGRSIVDAACAEAGLATIPSVTNFIYMPAPLGLGARLRAKGIVVPTSKTAASGGWLRVTIGTEGEMKRFAAVLKEVV